MKESKSPNYACPMHPEITGVKGDKCSICGMDLVSQQESKVDEKKSKLKEYKPLIVIIGLILLATVVLAADGINSGTFELRTSMSHFMAGFFIVFSGFKLLDLKGFAEGYSSYDLLARKLHMYGYVYPFLELTLGLLYLTGKAPQTTNIVALILMTFSGIGVVDAVRKKRKFQCACLGTIIKVPLTTVTIIEDFGMAAMAAAMLFL